MRKWLLRDLVSGRGKTEVGKAESNPGPACKFLRFSPNRQPSPGARTVIQFTIFLVMGSYLSGGRAKAVVYLRIYGEDEEDQDQEDSESKPATPESRANSSSHGKKPPFLGLVGHSSANNILWKCLPAGYSYSFLPFSWMSQQKQACRAATRINCLGSKQNKWERRFTFGLCCLFLYGIRSP